MLLGIGMILLGIILGLLTIFVPILYYPFGMLFALITSTQWAKELFAAVGLNVTLLYMWWAAGLVVLWVITRFDDQGGGGIGGFIIASMFILTGLLVFDAPAAFIAAHIMPIIEAINYRVGAFFFVILTIALFPLALVFSWLFSFWG